MEAVDDKLNLTDIINLFDTVQVIFFENIVFKTEQSDFSMAVMRCSSTLLGLPIFSISADKQKIIVHTSMMISLT